MLSKEQMEEMWQTGKVGVLKEFCKNNKNKTLFKVKVTPYKTVTTEFEEHSKTYEVWSKKQDEAIWHAQTSWYQDHRGLDIDKTGIKTRIVS